MISYTDFFGINFLQKSTGYLQSPKKCKYCTPISNGKHRIERPSKSQGADPGHSPNSQSKGYVIRYSSSSSTNFRSPKGFMSTNVSVFISQRRAIGPLNAHTSTCFLTVWPSQLYRVSSISKFRTINLIRLDFHFSVCGSLFISQHGTQNLSSPHSSRMRSIFCGSIAIS